MLIVTVIAPVFATNCYVIVADDGVSCVVVDPGGGVAPAVEVVIMQRRLRPVALLATHGHVDHTWDAARLSETYGVDLHLHAADEYRLADPFGTLGPLAAGVHDADGPLAQALASSGMPPAEYRRPPRVRTFDIGPQAAEPDLGGVRFGGAPLLAVHAPGHTEGATVFLSAGTPGPGSELPDTPSLGDLLHGAGGTAFTGDVLFRNSIGRTDLPGGDDATMTTTLRDRVTTLAEATLVLPGHGPATRLDHELRTNPYLA
ncbi:MBL fold metallo-hydrolase [Cellulomonas sp. ATA003]|uniref:MBL fold metallo-hydrolase n=1 Tax=Cellulomonas sp. ATA003 TaxID=3073064 RepID=UPI0028738355|nr:MBL fold metallo-hydrolase [Cellulomonas sp. ATA003]WNB87354.1 MBL fold metallo-hydrolase [Cellulomonas sp. ATA003]